MILVIVGFATGCAPSADRETMLRGGAPITKTITPWTFDGKAGRIILTDHYMIHTTIEDPEVLERLPDVMESALDQYRQLTPGVRAPERPMECYIFARRPQWAKFTQDHTGDDANVYLQINRGGYTVRDWYVAYFIGDVGTYAVAAHEGWHQYVARTFHSRMPPFLEEGIATMFENITWPSQKPHWNMGINFNRVDRLHSAIHDRMLMPLDKLCTMHAGEVVGESGERIETFYAQSWAFAHFLLYAENGKYRPRFQRMLSELASGEADTYTGQRPSPPGTWDKGTVKPLLEHYLDMNMQQIDTAYQAYMRQLANSRH